MFFYPTSSLIRKLLLVIILLVLLAGILVAALLISFPALVNQVIIFRKLGPTKSTESSSPVLTNELLAQFVLLGDTGSGTPAQFAVAQVIASQCAQTQKCQAAFIAGDIIYEKGVTSIDDPQFQTKFEEPYRQLNFPFYIAFGNHDYAGCTSCYIEYTTKSEKWRMPSSYYQQKFGEQIQFFVIDTEQFNGDQQEWLRAELASSSAQYKVVVGHRPIETYETTKLGEYWNGKKELSDSICNQADLYVAGHAHILEDIGQLEGCRARQLVTGGGGASIRQVSERGQEAEEFGEAQNGFVILSLFANKLEFAFYGNQGEILHQVSL